MLVRALRYAVSLLVAVGLTATVAYYFHSVPAMYFLALPLVYGVMTSLLIAHRETIFGTGQSRWLGGIVGGVGALSLSALADTSFPAAILGWGLMMFGMVTTAAWFEPRTADSDEQW